MFGEVVPESLIDRTLRKAMHARLAATGMGSPAAAAEKNVPAEAAPPSRVEAFVELAFKQRSSWPAFGRSLPVVIAVAAAAFAFFAFVGVDLHLLPESWGKFLSALVPGNSSGACH